jgi:hypothetical protein
VASPGASLERRVGALLKALPIALKNASAALLQRRQDADQRLARPALISAKGIAVVMSTIPPAGAFHDKRRWQHVAVELDKAATGGDAADVVVALRIALSLRGVEWRPK